MNHYIIDGNNLIGKIYHLQSLQKEDRQASREELVNIINRYFASKKTKLSLHLDGYAKLPLHPSKGKIVYSNNKTSDQMIREEIDSSPNPKLIILVSSDHALINYAKVNSCSIIKAEEFYREIEKNNSRDEEADKLSLLEKQKDEFLILFNRKWNPRLNKQFKKTYS